MRIDAAELRVLDMPLRFSFETSFGAQRRRYVPLLTLHVDGVNGYAEGVMDVLPLYLDETLPGAVAFVRDQLLPRLLGVDFGTPEALARALSVYRGNRMARAMVEMAFWDAWAKHLNLPLWRVLGGVRTQIPVGISLGIQDTVEETREQAVRAAAHGYRRVKLKIKPGWDEAPVRAVREALPDLSLTVDANSAYTLTDLPRLQALDAYHLSYIEQPLAHDDLTDHAELQAALRTPVCLDESIGSLHDARKALTLRAARVINLKVARVGGHLESRRIHDLTVAFNAPIWCGGMMETGVGRAHNLHLSTLENYTLPGDTASGSRYWDTDVTNEPLEAVNGLQNVPDGLGIGVTLNHAFIGRVTTERHFVRPSTTPLPEEVY